MVSAVLCVLSHPVVSDSVRPVDCSPPGSSVHGILRARVPEWVTVSFSRGSSWPRDRTRDSCTGFFTAEPPGSGTGSGAFRPILSLHSHHPSVKLTGAFFFTDDAYFREAK